MALQLIWSPEAIEDIEAIAAYIERDSPWYAQAVASRIVATAETIPEYPELGRVVPELGESDIREGSSTAIALSTESRNGASSLLPSFMAAGFCVLESKGVA